MCHFIKEHFHLFFWYHCQLIAAICSRAYELFKYFTFSVQYMQSIHFCSGWETIVLHYKVFYPSLLFIPMEWNLLNSAPVQFAIIRSLLYTRVILAPMLFSAFHTSACPIFHLPQHDCSMVEKTAHWQCEQIGPKYHMANIFVYTDFYSQLYFNTNVAS